MVRDHVHARRERLEHARKILHRRTQVRPVLLGDRGDLAERLIERLARLVELGTELAGFGQRLADLGAVLGLEDVVE